ncbi:MAG: hypothetical protein HC882_01850 [Acidobacteria bacterium]|nr:hypothetical protein [Acidobacteriota bacterium]
MRMNAGLKQRRLVCAECGEDMVHDELMYLLANLAAEEVMCFTVAKRLEKTRPHRQGRKNL